MLELDARDGPPLLSIFGGKITTYRRLALDALAKRAPFLADPTGDKPGWTANAPLPGGDFAVGRVDALQAELQGRFAWLDAGLCRRLARSYGTRAWAILDGADSQAALGRDFGGGLFEAEPRYLRTQEWAETAGDILWRRSKLGLRLTLAQIAALEDYMKGG